MGKNCLSDGRVKKLLHVGQNVRSLHFEIAYGD